MYHIIFVCTGNICRSAMAEGILKSRWAACGREGINVSSTGIHGLDNQPASTTAIKISKEHDVDISQHRSRPLNFEHLNGADLILCMEKMHKDFILLFLPHLADKVFLAGAWPDKETSKSNIKDPMGGVEKDFRQAYDTIAVHIDRMLPFLLAKFS